MVNSTMSESRNGGFFRNLFSGAQHHQHDATAEITTDSSSYLPIDQIINLAKPGDILEYQRGLYIHYALYLGNGKVLNVDVEANTVSEAHIREHTLEEVCDVGKARIRCHEDVAQAIFNLSPRPEQDIIKVGMSYVNKVVPYEFDFRNCEYYCTLWRYGSGFSTQAAQQASTLNGSYVGERATDETSTIFFASGGYNKYKLLAYNEEQPR